MLMHGDHLKHRLLLQEFLAHPLKDTPLLPDGEMTLILLQLVSFVSNHTVLQANLTHQLIL
jgi:hypothetical protein